MATNGLNVDLGASQASVGGIKSVVGEMQAIIARIKSSAATGRSDWSGKASNAFEGSHTDWHATAVRLQAALDEIEAKLTTGMRGYDDDDSTSATLVAGSSGGTLSV